MRIALVGPGILPIPPTGWGAVEILIWDYYQELRKNGIDTTIINTPNRHDIITYINQHKFDFVHIHYDVFYDIIPFLDTSKIALTSHYPYIDDFSKHSKDGFTPIFNFMIQNHSFINMPISKRDYETFLKHTLSKNRLIPIRSGANHESFKFKQNATYDKTICLGKIEPRKRQSLIQSFNHIDFVGTLCDSEFKSSTNYLGEWSKENLYEQLTNYTNLVLLSENENGYPLVVKEALMAGLGVVISENCVDVYYDVPFITVIPEEIIRTKQMDIIHKKIIENKEISKTMRVDIRAFGIQHFSYSTIVKEYLQCIEKLI